MTQKKKPLDLTEQDAGALQIGVTDHMMVRLIVTTRDGVLELDFSPDEADDIAHEITAAADAARRGLSPKRR